MRGPLFDNPAALLLVGQDVITVHWRPTPPRLCQKQVECKWAFSLGSCAVLRLRVSWPWHLTHHNVVLSSYMSVVYLCCYRHQIVWIQTAEQVSLRLKTKLLKRQKKRTKQQKRWKSELNLIHFRQHHFFFVMFFSA